MTLLDTEQVLNDNNTHDPKTIVALKLNQKALQDVSCLSDYKNLERLDLTFNNLISIEGLKACVNLKWLSVAQNKLENLKGIEALSKLTVLNAAKNNLKAMDEVRSLARLRALILNENQISSICRLDEMKDLNTLVLSKNPIGDIGESLMNAKSITKISLSHCQLKNISCSLKSCVELKELRLAHNELKIIPDELACNKKLQNLDLGSNVITSWLDVKVLNSLVNLKNLNLQGNPIAEKQKFVKKIQRTLPKLRILNAKPIEKYTANEKLDSANDSNMKKKMKRKRQEASDSVLDKQVSVQEVEKRDQPREKKSKHVSDKSSGNLKDDVDLGIELKHKKEKKKDKLQKKQVSFQDVDYSTAEKTKNEPKLVQGELDVIDNGEASFTELLDVVSTSDSKYDAEEKVSNRSIEDMNLSGRIASIPTRRKKDKKEHTNLTLQSSDVEIGLGGPSAWDDE